MRGVFLEDIRTREEFLASVTGQWHSSVETGRWSGGTALVTGASRGIGRAIAARLREAGAWVALVARGEAELRAAAEALDGHAVRADVSDPASVNRLVAYLNEVLGGEAPDIVVNAAGAFELAPLAETDPEAFDRQIAVNLRALFL